MGFLSKFWGKENNKPELSKKELTQDFIIRLREHMPTIKASISNADDPEEISVMIERENADPITFYPDNLYHAYLHDQKNFEQYRSNIIQNILKLSQSTEETEITLLPAIKSIDWINKVNDMTQSPTSNNSLVYLPLAGQLVITLALDMGTQMSFLTQDQLVNYSANHNIEEVYQEALLNFKDSIKSIELNKTNIGYMAKLDDNYEASLVLLIDDLLPSITLEGEPIIAIIARNQLFIADSQNQQQIQDLQQYAKNQMSQASYPLCSELFCLKDGKLAPYQAI